jgi:predicted RNase H-like HicB family nuclease
VELTVRVHEEEGAYWAEVLDMPGCFASGDTLDELRMALDEAVRLHRDEPFDGVPTLRVNELKLSAQSAGGSRGA